MKKKILAISLVVSLVAIAALGVTLAYFTDDDQALNTFTVGNVTIDLTEPAWDAPGGGLADSGEVYAGEALAKNPMVTNTGLNPCLVRLQVTLPTGFAGKIILENTAYNLDEGDADDYNSTNWYYSGGYYYYKAPLDPGHSTEALFQRIRFVTTLDGTEKLINGETGVVVRAEAVQAQGIYGKYADLQTAIANGDWSTKIVPFFEDAF